MPELRFQFCIFFTQLLMTTGPFLMSISFSLWKIDHRYQSCHSWPMVCWPLIVLRGRSMSSSGRISLCWWATQHSFSEANQSNNYIDIQCWIQLAKHCPCTRLIPPPVSTDVHLYYCQMHTRTGTTSSMASYSLPRKYNGIRVFFFFFLFLWHPF